MEVVDINVLSENERAIDYIKDIIVEVIMREKHFQANVIIEQKADNKSDIRINICDNKGYPEKKLKDVVEKYIRKHISRYINWKK